ncbi:hypothetical protein ANN_26901 [Periplaneta americana]|uniref:Reverse transcriptase domain-containing protein n=1 Tax=Periplaneta americana TaxID=6978 RepID=A0ABQ8RWU5_PERAM|nr:hypothetical protein ANN_26901 [Periplaneta americana]
MFRWISEFLSQRFIATKFNNSLSSYRQTYRGLPQGAVLSTTLFNIYINDLPSLLEESNMKTALFADDIVLWTSGSYRHRDKIQNSALKALNQLHEWNTSNLMTLNLSKSNYQIFSLGKKKENSISNTMANTFLGLMNPNILELFSILHEDECDRRQVMKGEERLKNLLTPQYSWLFIHMGRLERGVKFLVDLRTDVLAVISDMDVNDPAMVPMQQLNLTLREMLSLWFSVGFLNLERVTWRSPCEMLQKISEYEAVHPVRNWTDLKRRVGLYRRCFVYTHSSMPDEPLVVLHTALSDEIAPSMKGIVSATSRMSVDAAACPGMFVDAQTEDPSCVKAAIFYSISSTQKGLKGIELGNYLIKRVVKELQTEFPLVNKFSSLSPIPTFRLWMMERLKAAEKGQPDVFTADEVEQLKSHLKTDNFWSELKQLFKTNGWATDSKLVILLEVPLMRLCARYLYLEKRRGYALDNVANFHLRNGAVMWRLNWQADTSPRGLGNSCGIMVNYRY